MPVLLFLFWMLYTCDNPSIGVYKHLKYEHGMTDQQALCLSTGLYSYWHKEECKDARHPRQ